MEPKPPFDARRGGAFPARLSRFARNVAFCCAIPAASAQTGPLIEQRRPPPSPAQAEKDEMNRMVDEVRTAIRNDDWAEAGRLSNRLNAAVYAKQRRTVQLSPDIELAHVELMAGKDATTRTPLLGRLAKAAFNARQFDKAESYAKQALEAATQGVFWWTGDAVHQGNIALGRLALQRGDGKAAAGFLLAAGKAPPSAALATFGPNMGLARDLLARGDFETVIQYLEECRAIWTTDRGKLLEWLALVRAGLKPDFGLNLDY